MTDNKNKKYPRDKDDNVTNIRQKKRRAGDIEKSVNVKIIVLVSLMVGAILFSGFFKVISIKIEHGDEYEMAAVNNLMAKVTEREIAPNRGDILDRNHQSLAVGNTVYNVILDVRILKEQQDYLQEATVDAMVSILGIDENKARGYLEVDESGNLVYDTNYQIIKKKVDYTAGRKISELDYGWLYTETDTKRTYNNDTLAAQVIGFIRGEDKMGLENSYDSELTGTPGRVFRTYEEDGSVITQQEEPVKGNTLITTIDQTMQKFAEEACKEAYNSYKPNYTATIIMHPGTGEVYAMAQYPSFYSNEPDKLTDTESDPELLKKWESMSEEERQKEKNEYCYKAWTNYSISRTFEPGSIYKPIVVAMALEEGLITPSSTFYCGGSKTVAGWSKPIHCHKKEGHGQLDVEGVLAKSCNVGMMEIISKMKPETYYKYNRDFGFHQKTGIDLPYENSASADDHMYSLDELNTVSMATSSFGQGLSVTPIQALTAYCATINGGYIMKPYVVSQVVDADGNVVKENSPTIVRRVISQETSDYLRKAMESVVNQDGTAKKAVIQGYSMGGKTGTAEQYPRGSDDYVLSFISYLPVDNPDVIVMTIIDRPEGYHDLSGISPVPMLRNVMEKIIEYKAIPPNKTIDTEDSEFKSSMSVLGDYTGKSLKETIAELVNMGFDYEIITSGGDTVTKYYPGEGEHMEKGGKVLINAKNANNSELVSVPDVSGLEQEQAKELLENAGFVCVIDTASEETEAETFISPREESTTETTTEAVEEETEAEPLTVYEQNPSAGKSMEAGTIVKIKVR